MITLVQDRLVCVKRVLAKLKTVYDLLDNKMWG